MSPGGPKVGRGRYLLSIFFTPSPSPEKWGPILALGAKNGAEIGRTLLAKEVFDTKRSLTFGVWSSGPHIGPRPSESSHPLRKYLIYESRNPRPKVLSMCIPAFPNAGERHYGKRPRRLDIKNVKLSSRLLACGVTAPIAPITAEGSQAYTPSFCSHMDFRTNRISKKKKK